MRFIIIIVYLIWFSSICYGQRKINVRIIDSITNKPLSNIEFYILRDNDKWIDIGETDTFGYFSGEIERREFNKKSSYQVLVDMYEYNLVTKDAKILNMDTVLIKLTKNSNYIPMIEGMTYKDCSQTSFGAYIPKEPRTLLDLPVDFREKIVSHIKKRVGNNFYTKLSLTGGQIVDLNRLQKVENYIKEYQWKPQSYNLCFSFRDTTLGIARFTAKMVLDKKGNVIEEIELPDIISDSLKYKIMNLQQAIEIAAKNNYLEKECSIDFDYDRKEDCFVWTFKKSTFNKDHTMFSKSILISAHNGKILFDDISGFGRWH